MGKIGKYIYGIIVLNENAGLINLSLYEVDRDQAPTNGAYLIPYQDIAAVVSDSEMVDCRHMFKDALARLLVEHQKVIEGIMGLGYTIIPMRLGTLALNEFEVKNILSRGYNLIKEINKKIGDKIEIDVAAGWSDFASILKESGEEKEIQEFKAKLLANPKKITVDDQIKVGAMVKDGLDRKKEKYSLAIQAYLRDCCEDVKIHELMDDKMVINSAFLMNKFKQKDFEKKIEEINNKFEEKLNFRCIGPLPPYSFYTLEVNKLEFEDLGWAKTKFGLKNTASKNEINDAYQKAALSSHPDRNPNTPGIEKEFDEVNKAHKILVDYCQACEQTNQGILSFDEKEFKNNAISVQLRG